MAKKRKKQKKLCIFLVSVLLALTVFVTLVGMKVISVNTLFAAGYPVKGVDVSHYQGEVDWSQMKDQGMEFAYIKATEGSGHVDDYFEKNWTKAREAGMVCGAYHFFSFESEGKKQAKHFIKKVGRRSGMLIPVIDVEYYGKYAEKPPKNEKVEKELGEMIGELEKEYGKKPMIYCTYSVYNRYIKEQFSDIPLWIRNVYYLPKDIGREWTFWQYTDKARLAGYEGEEEAIDCNAFRWEKEKLQDYILEK